MNVQIYEEASDWIVKHRSGSLDTREKHAFDLWLRRSPLHMHAYLEMSSIWESLSALDSGGIPCADVLIAQARADSSVVPFVLPGDVAEAANTSLRNTGEAISTAGTKRKRRGHSGTQVRRRPVSAYALAACLFLVAALAGWFHIQPEVYSTGIGEQRSLTLEDGSTVVLNARSRITVKYARDSRNIDVLEGQALFRVAKNPERPFIVKSGDARMMAIGTSFDVRRGVSSTVVTVVEGRVAVYSAQTSAPDVRPKSASDEVVVNTGEQVIVTQVTMSAPRPANVATTLAWTQRHLVLATVPLPKVAEELNRYSKRPLVIQDPTLADFNVSGVFSTTDTSLLLQFLRTQPELVVEETKDEIRVRRR